MCKVVFTLADPFTDEVRFVGEAADVYSGIGNALLRPPSTIREWLNEMRARGQFPAIGIHLGASKSDLLAAHKHTVLNRRGFPAD